MNTAKLRRFFSVFVRVHLWVVGLVLGIVLLLLAGLLFTPPGRSLLASLSLGIANRALPGTLELVELERLDFWEVSLRGVTVRDAKGEVVARAGHIRVELEPGELVHGRIVGERVTLEDVWVDLRTISESERGLVSAFVDAHAPPSPPSPSTGPPPYIRVDHISLRGGAARLPEWPQVGQLDVHELELEGSFLLDGEPSARVTSARFRAERAGQSLLWLDRLQADWTLASRPSSVALAAHTEGMQLEIEGKGVAPPAAGYQDAALEAHVGLRGATALECATLLQEPSLADAFRGEVGLDLRVEGTPRHARLTLRTETAGGQLQLAARADEFSRLSATLEPQGLRLSEIRAGLPAEPLSGRLEAKLDASSPEAMSWEVALGQGRLGEVQLPELSARGVLGANELRELDVRVTDGPSRVEAKGRVGFDGSMQLQADVRLLPATLRKGAGLAGVSGPVDGQVETRVELRREVTGLLKARGSASLRSVVYQENRVGSADAQFDVQGVPPNLRGEVLVQAKDVQAGGQRLDEARISARGGPSHYDVGVEAKSPEINGKGQLSVDVGRSDITVSGAIDGNYRGSPVQAEIDETVIGTANGSVRTEGISARLGDETLRLRGAVEPNRVDVAVQTDGAVELGRISKLLGIEPPLSGRARLDGRVHGTPVLPFLEVKAVLDRVTWGERPPVDGDFELKLDAQKGQLSFSGEVLASDRGADGWRPLELVGKLDHRFRGGRGYEKRIARGRPDGHVEIRSLDLAFVEAWAGIKLPVSGHLGATLDAGGSWESPTLDLSLRSKLQVRGDPRIIDVDGELTLADERWVTHWALADQRGRWVALDAEAVTPRSAGRDEPLASRLAELPAQGKWSVRTKVEPRSLAELPLLRLLDDVPPALLSAELEIEHEANEEPRGKAHVTLAQSEKIAAMGACQGGDLRLDAELRFAQGQWELQLGGQHRGAALFQARSQGRLALAPALTGGAVE
ncbi:MAG TPA: hypothetical protein VLC09_03215, partial [Polyangiaceae bacterium]|nr:hypothetical protein [Polyangiaceae bacterium]